MADNFNRAKDLYDWDRRVLTIMGVWILQPSYVKFGLWIIFLTIHLITEFADLLRIFGDLDLLILSITEIAAGVMIFIKMMVLRCSGTMGKVMNEITDCVDSKRFANTEEMRMYLKYNSIAKFFFKLYFVSAMTTAVVYHLKPLESLLRTVLQNESTPLVLPYRTHFIFFDVNDTTTFWLVWIYQTPIIYVHAFHPISIGCLFSIVLHVCGQLSALASTIKSIDVDLCVDERESRNLFCDIVETHCNIIRLASDIEKVFNLLLMEELFFTTLIIGLTAYNCLMHTDGEQLAIFLSSFIFGTAALVLIYGYCLAGEYLIIESTNVYNSYYQCRWYDSSTSFKKQLIISMIGASKPLQLTGGGFYIYSVTGFMDVLKTALGYISMLRTIT